MKKLLQCFLIIAVMLFMTSCDSAETLNTISIEESGLFYQNGTSIYGADPFVLYDDTSKTLYMYSTSREMASKGFEVYSTKDMSRWTKCETAMVADGSAWYSGKMWAPEVIEEDGTYYMFYSAQWQDMSYGLYISVAVADNPCGPFIEYSSASKSTMEPLIQFEKHQSEIPADLRSGLSGYKDEQGFIKVIDASPFVDPATDRKYLFFTADIGTDYTESSFIMAMEMQDWVTPIYSTLTPITRYNCKSTNDDTLMLEGGNTNEGASVLYYEGKYYLTFSTFTYTTPEYQIRQAIADSPLGPYTKIVYNDGGTVIFTEGSTIRQSAGHGSFVTIGDDTYLCYHTFFNDSSIDEGRKPAFEKICFVENSEGITVMQANGPTTTPQPLPSAISGYENIADKAQISCDNGAGNLDVSLLNDGYIPLHRTVPVSDYVISAGKTTITFTFDRTYDVRAIMVYSGVKDFMRFTEIESVTLISGEEQKVLKNIALDDEIYATETKLAYDASAIAVFEDTKADTITLVLNEDYSISIPEIIILGK